MQLDALLAVAIGLVFTWLVLSVATVQAQESIGNLLNWRADFLEQSIMNMLKNPELVRELYDEPLIQALVRGIERTGSRSRLIFPTRPLRPPCLK